MKLIKIFGVFVLLHALGWFIAHSWLNASPKKVLLVVDTSYAMKPHFSDVEKWITQYQDQSRYSEIYVATDKEDIGKLDDVKSKESLFRTAFGKLNADSLVRYDSHQAGDRILLSDGSVKPKGWQVVDFTSL